MNFSVSSSAFCLCEPGPTSYPLLAVTCKMKKKKIGFNAIEVSFKYREMHFGHMLKVQSPSVIWHSAKFPNILLLAPHLSSRHVLFQLSTGSVPVKKQS